MADVNILLVVAVVMLGVTVQLGDGCYCQLRHPQEHYCTAEFVILASVLEKDIIKKGGMPIEIHYKIKVKHVFKSTPEYENATKTVVISPASPITCGVVDLQNGANYLITGFINDGNLRTTLCDWVKPYKHLTTVQKNGLKFKYESGCQCEFAFCHEGNCFQQYDNATCEWELGNMFDCYHDDGICYYDGQDCAWRNTKQFQNCEQKLLNHIYHL